MTPCPCGSYGDIQEPCTCAHALVTKYQKRILGPLRARIDIHFQGPRVDCETLSCDEPVDTSMRACHRMGSVRQARIRFLLSSRSLHM
jgi:magnesium chelatase family protein